MKLRKGTQLIGMAVTLLAVTALTRGDEVRLFLYSDGTNTHYVLQGRKTDASQLRVALKHLTGASASLELPIWVHPNVQLKDILSLVNTIYTVGLTNLVVEMHDQPTGSDTDGVRLRTERGRRAETEEPHLTNEVTNATSNSTTNAVTSDSPTHTTRK